MKPMLRIDFVTLFPEMMLGAVGHSILRRATESGIVSFGATNPRDFTHDNHRTVDDNPFGGGPGMLMKCEPMAAAIDSLQPDETTAVVITDPTGVPFSQSTAHDLAGRPRIVFLCGHYEGIDDRIRTLYASHTISIGDFVLTGGELPSLVMADAVVRLLPGSLGCADSLGADSHSDGLLSAPQFTRPEDFRNEIVPDVLRSGDHGAIEKWRRKQSLIATRTNRPDLFWRAHLGSRDAKLLSESESQVT
jgi:tRNA (guanine37-N1)-methyltransferase